MLTTANKEHPRAKSSAKSRLVTGQPGGRSVALLWPTLVSSGQLTMLDVKSGAYFSSLDLNINILKRRVLELMENIKESRQKRTTPTLPTSGTASSDAAAGGEHVFVLRLLQQGHPTKAPGVLPENGQDQPLGDRAQASVPNHDDYVQRPVQAARGLVLRRESQRWRVLTHGWLVKTAAGEHCLNDHHLEGQRLLSEPHP